MSLESGLSLSRGDSPAFWLNELHKPTGVSYNSPGVHVWLARNGSISIRDQLVTQLTLAIASGELAPGKRLPSTRALARRFHLHPNTVSAAYQELQNRGWVQSLRGSGVFVRVPENHGGQARAQALDLLCLEFLRRARSAGLTAASVQERLHCSLASPPRRFVFVHSEESVRAIVCQELRQALVWEVLGLEPAAPAFESLTRNSLFVTVPSKYEELRAMLPPAVEAVPIQVRSVAESLASYLPLPPHVLVVIASGWATFLDVARTVLAAAGADPGAVQFLDSNAEGWANSIATGSVAVCDVLTAAHLPQCAFPIVFRLVSDAAIDNLKTYQRFYA